MTVSGCCGGQSGGWEVLGEVSLDTPDLPAALNEMRPELAERARHAEQAAHSASQILYTTVSAPGPSAAARRRQIAEALEGLTPYAVSDLVFDWSGRGDEVRVAVVARETLEEAEHFAQSHGFCPVAFAAIPEAQQFGAEPWFRLTSVAARICPKARGLNATKTRSG
ncbi:MAG: hypothetical protein R3D78_11195 [Paracoccaceae bacterium]